MKILVVNCGSSSLKYKLFDMATHEAIADGLVDRIGTGNGTSHFTYNTPANKIEFDEEIPNHGVALQKVLELLGDKEQGVISDLTDIGAVGHRVLHGKETFPASVLVDDDILKTLHGYIDFGPLHMPANLMGIEACRSLMPNTPQIAVFDTSFHQTIPRKAFLYALTYELYEKYGIRRYGFHGTSHRYVSQRSAEMLGKSLADLKMITLHLGNGCSAAAIKNGKCIDTSMGFTPLEGLVMGTRCGDIDPALVPLIGNRLNLDNGELDEFLNKKCGLLGISGISSDMRDIQAAVASGDQKARDALDIFIYRIVKYVGAYYAALGGLDVLVFTAGIGENDHLVRQEVCENLTCFGVKIDKEKNASVRSEEAVISAPDSSVDVLLTPTNEELMIALDAYEIVNP